MNIKRYIIASIVIFIVMQLIGYLIHNVLLMPDYMALSALWRPEMMSLMWIMWLTGLLFSFVFVYIFIKGYERRGIVEGIRYGLIIAFFMTATSVFGQYVIYPLPLALVLKWLVFGFIELIIYGIIAALIYKPK